MYLYSLHFISTAHEMPFSHVLHYIYILKNLTLTLLPKAIYLEMHCLIAEIRKKNPLKHERQWNENQKSDSVVPSLYHCIQFFRYKGLTCELSSSLSSYNITLH